MGRFRLLSKLALLLAVFVAATAGTVPGQAARGQARPIIDTGYLYDQLFLMSTSYTYRVSGADGPPIFVRTHPGSTAFERT